MPTISKYRTSGGWWDRLQAFVYRCSLWPTTAAVVTLLGLVAGVFGALYNDQIKAYPPFAWSKELGNRGLTVTFWVAAILTAVLFHLRQRGVDLRRRESEERLDDVASRLEALMRTLPPANFLAGFENTYHACQFAVAKIPALISASSERAKTLDAIEEAIRLVLNAIATLAAQFDEPSVRAHYGVNIMLYRDAAAFAESELEPMKEKLLFLEPEITVRALRGVLDLQNELSTTTASDMQRPEPDPRLRDLRLALPVPREPRGEEGASRLLPGAVDAYVENVVVHYATLDEFFDDLQSRDVSPSVKRRIRVYFKPTFGIASFLSVRLPHVGHEAVGVLNIDCDRRNLLRARESAGHFVRLLTPFEPMLVDLLQQRSRAQSFKPKSASLQ